MAVPFLILGVWGVLLFGGASGSHGERAGMREPVKKLVEFGWDEPDTAFLRRHIAEMEQTPFDGCVFHVLAVNARGGQENFTWLCWGRRSFSEAELGAARADLRATPVQRFSHNFLRFNATPGKVDWFDDFVPIVSNARLAARVARQGKCKGILFDIEEYEGKLFTYLRQREAKKKSWQAYAAQARRRGREVMDAFQEGFPDLTVFFTFGHSLPWRLSGNGKKPLAECSYGLLAPFLDGAVDAARGKARLVDGYELSYGYRKRADFAGGHALMKKGVLPIVADPEKYGRVVSGGFGIWLDNDWRRRGWSDKDEEKNYFRPATFEASVRAALELSDEYVWVYTETPRWWSDQGKPIKLPEAYAAALRRARKGLALD